VSTELITFYFHMSFIFETIPPFALDEKRHRIHQQHKIITSYCIWVHTRFVCQNIVLGKMVGAHYWTDSILRCQLYDDGLDKMMDRINDQSSSPFSNPIIDIANDEQKKKCCKL
jgi:hypothetical protein